MRAIVLSGGGSKGAYEIGVWKALRKLHIKYDIVTGTSVGALNAALMTQKTYHQGLYLWEHLTFEDVVDNDLKVDVSTKKGKNKILKTYAKGIIRGGLSVSNLEKTLDETISLKKIYTSRINMGIVTVKFKNLEPVVLTKNEIKPCDLKKYLIASASCFPAFQRKKIKDEFYMDGGMFDNLPINLAIDMGATEIIAVDLKEVGFKQKVKNQEIKITTISPRNDIGSFLIFDSSLAKRAIQYGFNDTMKVFGKYDGNLYTFKKDHLSENYLKYKDLFESKYRKKIKNSEFNKIVENLGNIFQIDDTKIYSISRFNRLLIKKFLFLKEDFDIYQLLSQKKIKTAFSEKSIVKIIYDSITDSKEELEQIMKIFSMEYKEAIYLKCIIGDSYEKVN